MDRISVVTPTYNRPAPLARALASLSAQEIGADANIVRVGWLFHDIGKVIEGEGSHVT